MSSSDEKRRPDQDDWECAEREFDSEVGDSGEDEEAAAGAGAQDRTTDRFPQSDDRTLDRFPQSDDRTVDRFPRSDDRTVDRFPRGAAAAGIAELPPAGGEALPTERVPAATDRFAPDEATRPVVEEFGGPTRPISAAQLQQKLTESWLDSPDDDLEITVGPDAEPGIEPEPDVLTDGVELREQPMPAGEASAQRMVVPRAPSATPAIPSERLPDKFRVRGGVGPRVGVAMDFGTTRSSVAVVVDGRVHILPLPNGRYDTLSMVGIQDDGAAVIGDRARELYASDPRLVLSSPKRLLGRQIGDREITGHLAELAIPSSQGSGGSVALTIRGTRYTVPQLCAPILYYLRLVAEQHLGQEVREVVLTAPTSFETVRQRALAEAAALAGLRVRHFVDEPAAAALANRQDKAFSGLVGVYDFGGGTFDFSVIDVATLKMVTTSGDSWLGGDDFDEVIAAAAANAFWRDKGIELRKNVVQWQRLRIAAEEAKRTLSVQQNATVELPEAALTSSGPIALSFAISRAQFAELCKPLIARTLDTCQLALDLSGLDPGKLNAVYLSGGTSHIPAVQQAVGRFFGKPPLIGVPPEQAVVLGAACYAALPPRVLAPA